MRKRWRLRRLADAAMLAGLIAVATGAAGAAPAARVAARAQTSGPSERRSLSLTVYSSGAALVRDTRRLQLPDGIVRLSFTGVARRLEPDSVQAISLTAPSQLTLLGLDYQYNLLNPLRLLQAYTGKTLTIELLRLKNGAEAEEPVRATLLAANPGPVWQINGKIETGLKVERIIFPGVPSRLHARPALMLKLENHDNAPQKVRISYLAQGLSWSANYIAAVGQDWKTANLSGRVTINNQSGADYNHVAVQLIAGQVSRVAEGSGAGVGGVPGRPMVMDMMRSAPLPQQPFAGYHLYTLPHHTNLRDNTMKEINLLQAENVRITRSYVVNGQAYYYRSFNPMVPPHDAVEIHLKFVNSKANSLGVPLPAGVVRVYRDDAAGRQQLIGEDQTGHIAKDEAVRLDLGAAFDVVETVKQTGFQSLGPNASESSYQITLRNHQRGAIKVLVNESFGGDWRILSSSFPYKKTSAASVQFSVPVPAGGTAVLRYQVRVRW